MRVILFLFLFALIFCQIPVLTEQQKEERAKRRKRIQKEIADCILENNDISEELRTAIEQNPDEDLGKVVHKFLDINCGDREFIKDCRNKIFAKVKEELNGRRRIESVIHH